MRGVVDRVGLVLVAMAAVLGGVAGCSEEPEQGPVTLVLPPTSPPSTQAPQGSPVPQTVAAGDVWQADVSSCPDSSATAALTGPVRVGVVGSLGVGIRASAAAGIVDGLEASLAALGAPAGVEVEVVLGDDGGDPATAPGVVELLLADGVDLLVGTIGTATVAGVESALAGSCVPHLFVLGLQEGLDDPQRHPWTTAGTAAADVEVAAYLASLTDDQSTIAVVLATDEVGAAYGEAFDRLAAGRQVTRVDVPPAAFELPAEALSAVSSARPDAVFLGVAANACPGAVQALDGAQSDAWQPVVFLTRSCSNVVTARLAGPSIDGVVSSVELLDQTASTPEVVQLVAGLPADAAPLVADNAVLGWHIGELLVTTLSSAAASPTGLTRQSIIEAARALSLSPTMGLEGSLFGVNGTTDTRGPATLRLVRWSADAKASPIGEIFVYTG